MKAVYADHKASVIVCYCVLLLTLFDEWNNKHKKRRRRKETRYYVNEHLHVAATHNLRPNRSLWHCLIQLYVHDEWSEWNAKEKCSLK